MYKNGSRWALVFKPEEPVKFEIEKSAMQADMEGFAYYGASFYIHSMAFDMAADARLWGVWKYGKEARAQVIVEFRKDVEEATAIQQLKKLMEKHVGKLKFVDENNISTLADRKSGNAVVNVLEDAGATEAIDALEGAARSLGQGLRFSGYLLPVALILGVAIFAWRASD